jgi:hypothetical protein
MERENLKKALNLGKLSQIGVVVRDLQRTIKNYEEVIGIGPFATIEFKPEKSFVKGRRGDVHFKIGIAPFSPEMSLELLEVINGEPYHKDFLEKNGEGIQHLGFFTDDYDGVLKRAERLAFLFGGAGRMCLAWAMSGSYLCLGKWGPLSNHRGKKLNLNRKPQ